MDGDYVSPDLGVNPLTQDRGIWVASEHENAPTHSSVQALVPAIPTQQRDDRCASRPDRRGSSHRRTARRSAAHTSYLTRRDRFSPYGVPNAVKRACTIPWASWRRHTRYICHTAARSGHQARKARQLSRPCDDHTPHPSREVSDPTLTMLCG
jgi:hypothetical protein